MGDLALWQMLTTFLLGCVATGALMLIRGDALGRKAADAVEARLNDRMDREFRTLQVQLNRIEGKLK